MKLFKPSISFFCPAYNDEKSLPILIPKTVSTLKKVAAKFEIVIVEDGSSDGTAALADKEAEKYKPFVRVLHHIKNLGYGVTLKHGFQEANRYDYVFYTDGDNQYDVSELKKLVKYLSVCDVVIGFRLKRALTLTRLIQSYIYNWLVRALFKVKVKDINCSMKLIKRSLLEKISLSCNSCFIEAELLIKLKKKGIKFCEVGVFHYPRAWGKASGGKLSLIADTIKDMLYFWWRHR